MKPEKWCAQCWTTKTADEFYHYGHKGSLTLSYWCKDCTQKASKDQARTGYFRDRRKRLAETKKPIAPIIKKPKKSYYVPKVTVPRPKISPAQKCAIELFRNAKKREFLKGIPFSLTREWLEERVVSFCNTHYVEFSSRHPFKPSLHRIDSNLGYTPENCKIIWLIENYALNSFTEEQLIEFCKRKLGIYGH